ncbi:Cytochrome P450 [Mycena sanguinolenta]|uniref:Cytochrome P450 n=1 Tax=Mycena sanguinolenta TaxID=230812 RepID=A0A8H6ZKB7_9AGAR|nr:Cytochrome P450 [Mycena sanguinolenta]
MVYKSVLAAVTVILALHQLSRRRKSIIHNIPGPPSPSWIYGHMLQLIFSPEYGDHEFVWQKTFGLIYRLKGCFGEDSLMISDPVALQYIVNSTKFGQGPVLENVVNMLFGKKSLVVVKGGAHKRLRGAMNMGFTAAAVRTYQPVLLRAVQELSERLEESYGGVSSSSLNLCPLLGDTTFRAAVQVGLGCSAEDLGEEFLVNNLQIVRSAPHIFAIGASLPTWIWRTMIHAPLAAFKDIRTATRLTRQLGRRIVDAKLDSARQGLQIDTDVFGILLAKSLGGKTRHALSPEEVAAQFSALVYTGQDPTANTIAFGLLELARHPEFQQKLRAEIQSNVGASYENMPVLNAFIKEVLRLYPSAALIQRVAVEDTILPLSDSIKTATGELMNEIPIRRGQLLTLGVASFQRLERYWGTDAQKFRPSRWLDDTITPYGSDLGPYANLASFLNGHRVCLGWRFAILEMQVFFHELISKFHFTLSEDDLVRVRFSGILIPALRNSFEKAAPICITPI